MLLYISRSVCHTNLTPTPLFHSPFPMPFIRVLSFGFSFRSTPLLLARLLFACLSPPSRLQLHKIIGSKKFPTQNFKIVLMAGCGQRRCIVKVVMYLTSFQLPLALVPCGEFIVLSVNYCSKYIMQLAATTKLWMNDAKTESIRTLSKGFIRDDGMWCRWSVHVVRMHNELIECAMNVECWCSRKYSLLALKMVHNTLVPENIIHEILHSRLYMPSNDTPLLL